jgi:hypothetical protein
MKSATFDSHLGRRPVPRGRMKRNLACWWSQPLLDEFLQRRRAQRRERALASDPGCTRLMLAELMAAATVLDFGGFPFEIPVARNMRRGDLDDCAGS